MIGRHLLIDFHGASADRLDDAELFSRLLAEAALSGGLTPLGPPVLHRFEGGGLTGYLLLSESHIAVHTYPELGFAAVDIFACGSGDPLAALEVFRSGLAPCRERVTTATRGTGLDRRALSASIPEAPAAGAGRAP
jgi:S-adenosylmethionine decarboxylase